MSSIVHRVHPLMATRVLRAAVVTALTTGAFLPLATVASAGGLAAPSFRLSPLVTFNGAPTTATNCAGASAVNQTYVMSVQFNNFVTGDVVRFRLRGSDATSLATVVNFVEPVPSQSIPLRCRHLTADRSGWFQVAIPAPLNGLQLLGIPTSFASVSGPRPTFQTSYVKGSLTSPVVTSSLTVAPPTTTTTAVRGASNYSFIGPRLALGLCQAMAISNGTVVAQASGAVEAGVTFSQLLASVVTQKKVGCLATLSVTLVVTAHQAYGGDLAVNPGSPSTGGGVTGRSSVTHTVQGIPHGKSLTYTINTVNGYAGSLRVTNGPTVTGGASLGGLGSVSYIECLTVQYRGTVRGPVCSATLDIDARSHG